MKIIKDFDLLSPKWLEIAFEKKNKQYGAYELRNDSSNRHLKALIIVFAVGLLSVFLPKIVSQIEWKPKDMTGEGTHVMVNVTPDPEPEPDKPLPQDYEPPPPILQKSIQFVQYTIDDDTKVNPDQLQTIEDITKSDVAVAATTVTDGDDKGVNVDELNKIVNLAPVDDNEIHKYVPVRARFPGGEAALQKWLNENINYPIAAQEVGAQGRVFVNFIVRSTGIIDGVKVQRGIHPSLDNEAIRLVKAMPRWQPGENDKGQKVSSYFTLPVTFILK